MEARRPTDVIYDLIKEMSIGDVVTYGDLETALGKPVKSRSSIYAAIRRSEREQRRSLDNVSGVGYRMVEAAEHETLGRRHHKKSVRQMKRSWERLHSADRALLTPEERERIDRLEMTVARQQSAIRSLEQRVARQETALDTVRYQTKSGDEALSERLERMEAALSDLLDGRLDDAEAA